MEGNVEDTLKKAAAASAGALLTSLFVTPLDVAKVRIQSQLQLPLSKPLSELRIVHSGISTFVATAVEQCRCRNRCACNRSITRPVEKLQTSRRGCNALSSMRSSCSRAVTFPQFQGTSHALRHVFQTEGLRGLYTGLSPAMVVAVPSTVLYYISYDVLLHEGRQRFPKLEGFVPLMAGTAARVVAASITSPMELIRTRMQSASAGCTISAALKQAVRSGGYMSLLNGLGATLARDVPFSAIYWTSYENLQRKLSTVDNVLSRSQKAFVCGAVSGSLAATVTTPFDVVKTLQQVSMTTKGPKQSGIMILKKVIDGKGVSAAFTGLSARLARVAPSCAIMISCYEFGKEKLNID
ncbi:mitochondrial carrier family [Plasmopara halstedii]|uniref:Mitochondrial carrier family n=1 Tax=Plasmopara halstedii TaxID=4781 RepID=A0A0P1AIZ7_PLAHL|nr:mitochondrial carrier family [Plasmopara halstedii]CEG40762.1 mitochondrial carrier family [Plasmopara halstedii]|eukprot:XP_024577131.1 mitochondrial carrier family [Plasmopara halstedii]